MERRMPSAPFNVSVVKKFLLNIRISNETGEHLGVSPTQLERWVHELASQLDTVFPAAAMRGNTSTKSCDIQLRSEEIHFLLDGYTPAKSKYA